MEKHFEQTEFKDTNQRVALAGPQLAYIEKTLEFLRPIENEMGEEVNWKDLYKEVKPWNTALELTDNIREVVRDYVAKKVPDFREKVPTVDAIEDITDKKLVDSLVNNWSDEIEGVDGQRKEVLLAVAAQVVKRIETVVYKKLLNETSSKDFEQKLGMAQELKEPLIDLLDVSQRADPLFVRFLAFSQLSLKPPKGEKSGVRIFLPHDPVPHTIAELFPHETFSISKSLRRIADNSAKWETLPGADTFKVYLETLSNAYGETDVQKAEAYLKLSEKLYEELLGSEFPIIVSSGMTEGSYYKEPYVDPELKISISTADARQEEVLWRMAQKGMADSLGVIGATEFADSMKGRIIRSAHNVGGHGVNLVFNSVADEEPGIMIFFNEQMRAFDRDFPEFISVVTNRDQEFPDRDTEGGKLFMERMSRSNTVHHELAHSIYPSSTPEASRISPEKRAALTVIDEVKAETLYRTLIPKMIEGASIAGDKKQWAVGMLTSSMQMLKDNNENPDDMSDGAYYYASVYTLNDLFQEDAIKFEGNRVTIIDFDQFYEINRRIAVEVLGLYRDEQMTEEKAEKWIRQRCRPNKQVKALEKFLKKKFKLTNEIENS